MRCVFHVIVQFVQRDLRISFTIQADSDEPNWQHAFFGKNYPRLLTIKDKWDPEQILYGATAVGGDRWAEDENGRLCRVH